MDSAKPVQLDLYDQQYDFVTSPHRLTAFIGGIGSGKTTGGAVKALLHSTNPRYPEDLPTLGMVMAPTYRMLKDATFRTFVEVAEPAIKEILRSDLTVRLKNGSEILFRSADDPDRLRGPNLHWAWIDEAAMCPAQTFPITLGRLRAKRKARPLWITGTPKGRNWLFTEVQNMQLFKARTAANPFLAPEFVRSLYDIYSGSFADQELEGSFIKLEGAIYEEWDEALHISPRPSGDLRSSFSDVFLCCDAGYTNPAVILVVGVYGDGRFHVIDEWYQRRQLNAWVGDAAVDFNDQYGPIDNCYVDPSAAALIAEFQSRDLPVTPANHDVVNGIQSVKSFLKGNADGPGLLVDPRCVNLISEFPQYIWKTRKDGAVEDKEQPVKQNDHAMDSLRYGIHTYTGGIHGQLMY